MKAKLITMLLLVSMLSACGGGYNETQASPAPSCEDYLQNQFNDYLAVVPQTPTVSYPFAGGTLVVYNKSLLPPGWVKNDAQWQSNTTYIGLNKNDVLSTKQIPNPYCAH